MILTILPASVSAVSNPTLKAVYSWSEDIHDSIDISMYDHVELSFFLDKGDNSLEAVSPDKLTLPDFITWENTSDNGMCVIFAAHTGSGSITYTDAENNVTCSLPVTVRIPDLGIYTATDFIEENLTEDISLTASNTKFYIALSPELVKQGYQMTEVLDDPDTEIRNPSITTVADVTVSDDGRYAVIDITEPAAEGSYHFRVTVSLSGGDTMGYGRGLTIVDGNPKLMVLYPEWDDAQGRWYVPDNCFFSDSLTLLSGERYQFMFCYGTEDSFTLADFSDLSFTGGVFRGYEENGAVMLDIFAYEGTGTVT